MLKFNHYSFIVETDGVQSSKPLDTKIYSIANCVDAGRQVCYSLFLLATYRDGIFKLLRSSVIYSKELIPPAYVAWRADTTTLFLSPIDCSKIPAQFIHGEIPGGHNLNFLDDPAAAADL
jgi:hypothetical protein